MRVKIYDWNVFVLNNSTRKFVNIQKFVNSHVLRSLLNLRIIKLLKVKNFKLERYLKKIKIFQ